jgi:hypothetical protein
MLIQCPCLVKQLLSLAQYSPNHPDYFLLVLDYCQLRSSKVSYLLMLKAYAKRKNLMGLFCVVYKK